jgi:hypothetical protein
VPRGSKPSDRQTPPDVELGAMVRANHLRFERVPDTAVEFDGGPGLRSHSGSERENLPDKVEPETAYQDVVVRWGAAATIRQSPRPGAGGARGR